jgi:hypothetical protein
MPEQPSDDMVLQDALSPRRGAPILLGAGALGLMLAGTLALWAHYGTAVFFETIRAGLSSCFG